MNYFWDERFRLFCRSTFNEVAYSDGTEGPLLSVIAQARDRGTFSSELAEAINDWPSEYHLSRARHCLIRPLGIRAGSKVLELGCGCGAVTRYLGEIGANVVAVEGNIDRARVAAERNRDLPNVRVVVDDLLLFETEETFDWVVLIGVLEYAAVFSTSQNPFESYLRSASRFLTRGGRVVVAIENKLGMKYFNGCAEDHVGAPYFGIQGLYGPQTPHTFSRRELIAHLAAAGLQYIYFYYPFPDYKLPSVVLTEDALNDPDFDPIDLIARSSGRDYSGSPYRVFDEALAFAAVGKNGLLADLSNSFLVVAAAEAESAIQASELATTFSYYRAPEFVTQTRFVRSGAKILVLKEHLVPWSGERSLVTGGMTITNRLDESAYRAGRQIIWRLLQARAKSGDLESVVAALQPWMEFLLRHSCRMGTLPLVDSVGQVPASGSYTLPGNFLDCTPFNLLESGEELASIDLEWCADRDVPLGWVVTRGVLWSLTSGLPTADRLQSVTVVIEALYKKFGFVVSEPDLQMWLEQEAGFQTMVTGRPHHELPTDRTSSGMRSMVSEIASLNQQLAARNERIVSLPRAVAARDEQVVAMDAQALKLKQEVATQHEQVAQQQREIAWLHNEVAIRREQIDQDRARIAVLEQGITAAHTNLSSFSWRITEPLRSLSSAFPRTAKISREALKVAYWTFSLKLPRRLRRRKLARTLLESGLFDPNFYLTQYPDVAKTGIDPLTHYFSHGVVEDRMPNSYFDTTFYLQQNADVAASGINPLVHYLLDGFREGREPSPKFSGRLYLEQNPDVAASGMNPLAHFLKFGRLEGRVAPIDPSGEVALRQQLLESGLFDPNFYLTQYPDVAKTGIDSLTHYCSHGVVEDRMPNSYFDTTFYLQQNADVAASGINPLVHYLLDGFREGREPSPKFSGRLYLEQNPDVAASGMNPLAHFLKFGRLEGRVAPIDPSGEGALRQQLLESGLFDPDFYLTQYPDVAKTGIDPLTHYCSHGVVEDRMPNSYFDTTFYLQQNADVAASGINPLVHYLLDGFREGREPSPKFSGRLYLEQNPDVAASGMNPLAHFLKFGRLDGRVVPIDPSGKGALRQQLLESGLFDPDFYLTQYPDVAKTGIDPLTHYCSHGVVEDRMPNSYFDTTFYLQQNADVAASGINPLVHYLLDGFREGREPSPKFSGRLYLEQNPDVAASGMNPLAHFLSFGRAEGRSVPVMRPSGARAKAFLAGKIAAGPDDPINRAELILQTHDNVRRILVIDHAVPSPDMDSGSVRMFGLLRLLRGLGSPVTFASGKLENDINHVEATEKLGVEVLAGYTDIRSHLEQRGGAYTLAIISRPETAATYIPLVRAYAPYAEVVYDSVDLHHLRFQRAAKLKNDPQEGRRAELYLQLETLAFTFADRSIAITETEKQAVLQKWPQAIVEVVPNVHTVRISPMPWGVRKGLVFIGGYDHEPNVDAVTWFVQEIFPKVQEQIPDIRFTILGSKPTESVKRLVRNNVEVLGWVPDPGPYFELSRIFVAPLRYGAGMKGKIGHAMSLGLPVVTTRIGAQGMQLIDGTHALIADDASAFAAAVARLSNDEVLWTSLQGAAAAHIERNFSDTAVQNILRRLFWGAEPSAKLGSG